MNQKAKLSLACILAAGTLLPVTAGAADFSDPYYDPTQPSVIPGTTHGNWTFARTRQASYEPPVFVIGTETMGGVNADTSMAVVLGTNDGGNTTESPNNCAGLCGGSIQFFIPAASSGPVSFTWLYETEDSAGAVADEFGYILDDNNNGVIDSTDLFTVESTCCVGGGSEGPNPGPVFNVAQDQLFGWYILTPENNFGPANATITMLDAPPVGGPPTPNPAPAPLALLALGLLIPALRKRG